MLLVLAATCMYIATRGLHDAAGGSRRGGALILAGLVPAMFLGLLAVWFDLPGVALTLPATTAVAASTLALGLTLLNQSRDAAEPDRRDQRGGMLMLPASLLALLVLQSGAIGWVEIGLLGACGIGLLVIVTKRPESITPWPIVQGLAAVALAVAAGWLAWQGTSAMGILDRPNGGSVTAVILLGPMLAVPLIGPSVAMASAGRGMSAVASLTALSALLVTFVLPATAAMLLLLGREVALRRGSVRSTWPCWSWSAC